MTILVIGSSGVVGSEVARLLEGGGKHVVRTTSRPSDGSDEVGTRKVHLDLLSGKGLENAFQGVKRAFLMCPSGYSDQYKILSPLIGMAKERGLEKVVLMTAIGVNLVPSSPMRRAEIELENSGLAYNIIRPNWFMQNFSTLWAESIRAQGKIMLPAGDARVSFIDSRDIAAVATALLTSDEHGNGAFDLTGSDAITHFEVAQVLTNVTGRTIGYEDVPPDAFKQVLLQKGVPEDYASFLMQIMGALKAGFCSMVTDSVPKLLGRPAASFARFAADESKAWM